jgi:hypothetical protein
MKRLYTGLKYCDCNINQPERLRRVDTRDSEAIVRSANIDEIAEVYRNDIPLHICVE